MVFKRVTVIVTTLALVPLVVAAAAAAAPAKIEVTRWYASHELATRAKGLHGVAPGGTIPFCPSHPYESIIAKVSYSGVSTSGLPYRQTFVGPLAKDGPNPAGFAKRSGHGFFFDFARTLSQDRSQHLVAGRYRFRLTFRAAVVAHSSVTLVRTSRC